MPLIDYPDLDEIDEETREMLERNRTEQGEIPSFPHMMANTPAILAAALGQFGEIMYGGNLKPDLKQLAFVVVSQVNECAYCAATHGRELVTTFGLPGSQLDALQDGDYTGLTDRQRTVAEFARQTARDPNRVSADHVESLREAGFDTADILELTAVVSQAAFANTLVDALNVKPSDQSAELDRYYRDEVSASGD